MHDHHETCTCTCTYLYYILYNCACASNGVRGRDPVLIMYIQYICACIRARIRIYVCILDPPLRRGGRRRRSTVIMITCVRMLPWPAVMYISRSRMYTCIYMHMYTRYRLPAQTFASYSSVRIPAPRLELCTCICTCTYTRAVALVLSTASVCNIIIMHMPDCSWARPRAALHL